jgi:hypothetical protein
VKVAAALGARLERLVWDAVRSRRTVAIAAGVLLVLVFLVAVLSGSPLEPAIIAYAVPVALVGIALGASAGMAAAVAGGALYWLAAYLDGHTLSAGHISYRWARSCSSAASSERSRRGSAKPTAARSSSAS